MNLQNITIISFGQLAEKLPGRIADAVAHEFSVPAGILECHMDLSGFYDPVRRQYNGNSLLREVDSLYGRDTGKVIALFSVDLFIPILTFIFGQAYLNGRTGIASIFRLSNEQYGLKQDENLISERFIKEVIHELGHTMGLIHCHEPSCVMRSSTYVEDIDQKGLSFCTSCRSILEEKQESH